MTATFFDTEQWAWRRAYKESFYGGVDNAVDLGDYGPVLVAVPSDFLKFLREVGGVEQDAAKNVYLYCEDVDGEWVFGYATDRQANVDLWKYKQLPDWLNPRL
jgi:hypothetical protein